MEGGDPATSGEGGRARDDGVLLGNLAGCHTAAAARRVNPVARQAFPWSSLYDFVDWQLVKPRLVRTVSRREGPPLDGPQSCFVSKTQSAF
jgi:hypothetical protein